MAAQQGRLRLPAARQQDLLPEAPLLPVQLAQCRDQPARIAGQAGRIEIGVELAGARQGQLEQGGELRCEQQEQQQPERHLAIGSQPVGQAQDGQHHADQRHGPGQPCGQIGQAHQPEIVVADMAELVGQDGGELAQLELAQQAVGEADDRGIAVADGKGIEHGARHVVELRPARQAGPTAEGIQDPEQLRQLLGLERRGAVHAQHHGRRDARAEQQQRAQRHAQEHEAARAEQDPAADQHEQADAGQQQGGLEQVAQLVAPLGGSVERSDPPRWRGGRRKQHRDTIPWPQDARRSLQETWSGRLSER